jgi:hypothetical protein
LTGRGRRFDVDVADIDRAAHEGAQLQQFCEDFAGSFGQAVGHDDTDIGGGLDQAGRIQRIAASCSTTCATACRPLRLRSP